MKKELFIMIALLVVAMFVISACSSGDAIGNTGAKEVENIDPGMSEISASDCKNINGATTGFCNDYMSAICCFTTQGITYVITEL